MPHNLAAADISSSVARYSFPSGVPNSAISANQALSGSSGSNFFFNWSGAGGHSGEKPRISAVSGGTTAAYCRTV